MSTAILKRQLTESKKAIILDIIIYLYVGLFIYTAGSKLMSLEKFQEVLANAPIIKEWVPALSWTIPSLEILLSILLILPATRKHGLLGSLMLMIAFTLYLTWMVLTGGENLPCSCGGVIAAMSWKQHIAFNIGVIGLALYGLGLFPRK